MRPPTTAEESNGIIAVLDSQVDFDIVNGALNNPVYRREQLEGTKTISRQKNESCQSRANYGSYVAAR